MLSANVRQTFNPKPKLVKLFYTGVIGPKVLYACQAWTSGAITKHKKEMKKLNRLTTTAMAPIRRSTPQAALEVLFDITPIDLGAASFLRPKSHLQTYEDMSNGHLNKWESTVMLNRPYNVSIVSLDDDSKNTYSTWNTLPIQTEAKLRAKQEQDLLGGILK